MVNVEHLILNILILVTFFRVFSATKVGDKIVKKKNSQSIRHRGNVKYHAISTANKYRVRTKRKSQFN